MRVGKQFVTFEAQLMDGAVSAIAMTKDGAIKKLLKTIKKSLNTIKNLLNTIKTIKTIKKLLKNY